jgi:hypothetical protein
MKIYEKLLAAKYKLVTPIYFLSTITALRMLLLF